MNVQPNKPLALAVLRARNGEIPGFEDFYLLTCQNTLADIRAAVPDEEKAFQVFREVYESVWKRRTNLPETGIVRPWIRVLIKEKARSVCGITIEEFPSELLGETVRDLNERFGDELVKIEDSLQLIALPDSVTGRKSPRSLPVAVMKLLLAVVAVCISLFLAFGILRSTGISLRELREDVAMTEAAAGNEAEESSGEITEVLPEEELFGWIDTPQGRRYRTEDGSYLESDWFEDGDRLYYFDGDGYAVTGSRRFSNQTVIFGDDGAVSEITRSYGHEKNQTVLSVQMRDFGHEEDAEYIVDDSIILDDDWIYYLYDEEGAGGLPLLLRVRRDEDSAEHISDRVAGYLVLSKNVWYCSDGTIVRFEKGQEATSVGSGYTVEEVDGAWYLKDHYGRLVNGVGGYESIGGRVYRVDEGLIRSVRQDAQTIGSYSFRTQEAGKSAAILLGDEREYLRQGKAVDALAVLGETLYYSVLLSEEDGTPKSQIWRVDVYTGDSKAVSGVFPGRIRSMLPFADRDSILMEYRPGGSASAYGKLAMVYGGTAYLIADEEVRKDGYSSGSDQLNPVWYEGDEIFAYWRDCAPSVASDGTVQVLDSTILTLSAVDRTRLGSGEAAGEGPVFFPGGGGYEALFGDPARSVVEEEIAEESAGESMGESSEAADGTSAPGGDTQPGGVEGTEKPAAAGGTESPEGAGTPGGAESPEGAGTPGGAESPAAPAHPAETAAQEEPAEPAAPQEPVEHAEPAAPASPVETAAQEGPAAPAAPVETEAAAGPAGPAAPEAPADAGPGAPGPGTPGPGEGGAVETVAPIPMP